MRRLLAALGLATLTIASNAHANGRFPQSNQILFAPEDDSLVLLRVTFGLLVSHDRGRSFAWICESSIGYSGTEDPMYTITPSAIVGSTYGGISVTRNRGCDWSLVGGLAPRSFVDLTGSLSARHTVIALESSFDGQANDGSLKFVTRLWESKDDGTSFATLGAPLDSASLGATVDVAPSDPDRLYITATRGQTKPYLLISRDHGKTWDELAIVLGPRERGVFIAGVDPRNADRVYLRTGGIGSDAPSRLLVVSVDRDGGPPAMETVFDAVGALNGFALSPDGGKVYVGGPADGIHVASTNNFAFQQRSTLDVNCLAATADGLWACSNERSGFVLGLSVDEGTSFTTRLRFCDIQGALTCLAGSTTSTCQLGWQLQRANLGCSGAPSSADGGSTEGSTAGSAPSASGGSGPKITPGGVSPSAGTGDGGRCSCRAERASTWGVGPAALALVLLLARRAGHRRC